LVGFQLVNRATDTPEPTAWMLAITKQFGANMVPRDVDLAMFGGETECRVG